MINANLEKGNISILNSSNLLSILMSNSMPTTVTTSIYEQEAEIPLVDEIYSKLLSRKEKRKEKTESIRGFYSLML